MLARTITTVDYPARRPINNNNKRCSLRITRHDPEFEAICLKLTAGMDVTTPTTRVKPKPRTRKREGLEDSTRKIIELMMKNGEMTFKDIHDTLDLDYRRAYDILNVLLTTPLIHKKGKKRDTKVRPRSIHSHSSHTYSATVSRSLSRLISARC